MMMMMMLIICQDDNVTVTGMTVKLYSECFLTYYFTNF